MKSKPISNTRVTQFFAFIQMHETEFVRLGDLQSDFQISARQEQELLSYLARKGSIVRLKRGVYVVPQQIPPGGGWQPDPKYLISCLMEVVNAQFYIGGYYAFHHHGLTEQIPNTVVVYNDKLSGRKKLGNLNVQFIKTLRIDNAKVISVGRNRTSYIATLERSIVDAFNDYKRYNTLPTAYKWILERLNEKKFVVNLIEATKQCGNVSTKRRIGFFLSVIIGKKKVTALLLRTIKPSQGWVPLDPFAPAKGKTNKEWGVINNVDFSRL